MEPLCRSNATRVPGYELASNQVTLRRPGRLGACVVEDMRALPSQASTNGLCNYRSMCFWESQTQPRPRGLREAGGRTILATGSNEEKEERPRLPWQGT